MSLLLTGLLVLQVVLAVLLVGLVLIQQGKGATAGAGFGGGASALVAAAEFLKGGEISTFTISTIGISVFIGTLTLTGSFTSGNFMFKPEFRIDSASSEIFAISPTETSDSLASFVMAMIYSF